MRTIELIKAQTLQRLLCTRTAARYLRLRGWSVEAAAWILARH